MATPILDLAALPLASPVAPAAEPTPLPAPDLGLELPDGSPVAPLAGGIVETTPAPPALFVMERVSLAPGDAAANGDPGSHRDADAGIEPIGGKSRAGVGTYDDGTEWADVYVQRGDALILIEANSPDGDPMPDAIAVAEAIVAR